MFSFPSFSQQRPFKERLCAKLPFPKSIIPREVFPGGQGHRVENCPSPHHLGNPGPPRPQTSLLLACDPQSPARDNLAVFVQHSCTLHFQVHCGSPSGLPLTSVPGLQRPAPLSSLETLQGSDADPGLVSLRLGQAFVQPSFSPRSPRPSLSRAPGLRDPPEDSAAHQPPQTCP